MCFLRTGHAEQAGRWALGEDSSQRGELSSDPRLDAGDQIRTGVACQASGPHRCRAGVSPAFRRGQGHLLTLTVKKELPSCTALGLHSPLPACTPLSWPALPSPGLHSPLPARIPLSRPALPSSGLRSPLPACGVCMLGKTASRPLLPAGQRAEGGGRGMETDV